MITSTLRVLHAALANAFGPLSPNITVDIEHETPPEFAARWVPGSLAPMWVMVRLRCGSEGLRWAAVREATNSEFCVLTPGNTERRFKEPQEVVSYVREFFSAPRRVGVMPVTQVIIGELKQEAASGGQDRSPDLTDTLLSAVSGKQDVGSVDVAEVDRRYAEQVASGRISEAKIREGFERRFPASRRATHKTLATEIGELVDRKQAAYGDAFGRIGAVLRLMYPNGIPPEKLDDAAGSIRVLDKLFRIANAKDAFGEDPWEDIAGYGILGSARTRATRHKFDFDICLRCHVSEDSEDASKPCPGAPK